MIYLLEYLSTNGSQDKKREHELGRQLLSFGLIKNYGRDYAVEQDGNNKPVLNSDMGIQFSISHTKGLVACGISRGNIGVDTEHIRPYDERLMKRVCTGDEIAYICKHKGAEAERFFRIWTLKESYLKATGEGISVPMKDISFTIGESDFPPPCRIRSGMGIITANKPGWEFRQFVFANKFIVSICVQKSGKSMEVDVI